MQTDSETARFKPAAIDGKTSFAHDETSGAESVWGFFYGGLINEAVMERVRLRPTARLLATLPNFELTISPWVNLVPRTGALAFGVLMKVTHQELASVYGQLKAPYVPVPVLAAQADGLLRAALCYIVPSMPPGEAEEAHVLPLLQSAEQLGFPGWYVEKIRSYLPRA